MQEEALWPLLDEPSIPSPSDEEGESSPYDLMADEDPPAGAEQILSREIFIPVWGSIRVTDREMQIIDHLAMQRLRDINQLGFTNVVFHGATHRRIDASSTHSQHCTP